MRYTAAILVIPEKRTNQVIEQHVICPSSKPLGLGYRKQRGERLILIYIFVPKQPARDGLIEMPEGPTFVHGIEVDLGFLELVLMLPQLKLEPRNKPIIVQPPPRERRFKLSST